MKITRVRLRQLEGRSDQPFPVREERLRMPTDIYPSYKTRGADAYYGRGGSIVGSGTRVSRVFVQIETDEGASGIAGPLTARGGNSPSFYIDTVIRPLLVGQNPMAIELLWDIMYRANTAGRKGDYMRAVSFVDFALWDLKGKYLGKPVCELLGGPVQEKIPAYISALGYSLEPEKVKERVRRFASEGYQGTKWFVREGPTDGPEGEKKNVALMAALREAAGRDMKIMLDAWKSWDVPYTLKMAELLKEYRPYWFEEPVLPDLFDSYAQLRAACPVLITGGEQHYTRWGFKMLMDMKAMDIYQPEPFATGGISEAMKICNLASAYDVPVIVHGGNLQANLQISFAFNSVVVPMMEYLFILQEGGNQFFYKNPLKPVNGFFYPPTAPGVIELDESKIESDQDVGWQLVAE